MDLTTLHIVITVLMFVSFLVLVFWAWSGRQKKRFEIAARAPLEGDDVTSGGSHG